MDDYIKNALPGYSIRYLLIDAKILSTSDTLTADIKTRMWNNYINLFNDIQRQIIEMHYTNCFKKKKVAKELSISKKKVKKQLKKIYSILNANKSIILHDNKIITETKDAETTCDELLEKVSLLQSQADDLINSSETHLVTATRCTQTDDTNNETNTNDTDITTNQANISHHTLISRDNLAVSVGTITALTNAGYKYIEDLPEDIYDFTCPGIGNAKREKLIIALHKLKDK